MSPATDTTPAVLTLEAGPAVSARPLFFITLALIAGYCIATLGSSVPPLTITAGLDAFHVGNVAAGLLVTAELIATAAVLLLAALVSWQFTFRTAGLMGLACILAGWTAPWLTEHYWIALCGRLLGGIGSGILLAATNSLASQCADPTRAFARMYSASVLFVSALYFIVPLFTPPHLGHALYRVMLISCLILAPCVVALPARRPSTAVSIAAGSTAQAVLARLILMFIGSGLFNLAIAMVVSFLAQFGEHAAVPVDRVSFLLSAASLIGLAGPVALSVVGVRFGRALPMALALLAGIASVLLIGFVTTSTAFLAGAILLIGASSSALPLFFGYAGESDPSGRWPSLLTVAFVCCLALGPLLAGALADAFGLAQVALVSLLLLLASAVVLYVLARKTAAESMPAARIRER